MEKAEQAFASGERVRNAPDKCQTCGQKNSSREMEPDELHSFMFNSPSDLRVFVYLATQDQDFLVFFA